MSDDFDVPLTDPAIMEEVELVSNLMIAAGESPGALSTDQIDLLLGILPPGHLPTQAGRTGR